MNGFIQQLFNKASFLLAEEFSDQLLVTKRQTFLHIITHKMGAINTSWGCWRIKETANAEGSAHCSLSSPSRNVIRLCSFDLPSPDLCDHLHSNMLAKLSELAPGFALRKGPCFILSILVSPAPAAVSAAE